MFHDLPDDLPSLKEIKKKFKNFAVLTQNTLDGFTIVPYSGDYSYELCFVCDYAQDMKYWLLTKHYYTYDQNYSLTDKSTIVLHRAENWEDCVKFLQARITLVGKEINPSTLTELI